jgi:CO/xanthine dehydrogenase Mo-binding subunit
VPESDGRLTVYTCTQAMYFTMGVLAEHLQRAPGSIKMVGGTVGGGFGGKVDSATEPLASVLALKARKPVRWIFSREEEMLCGSVRASWHVELADALTKDGWILGRKVLTLHDAGAYTRFSSYGATKHSFHLAGAYTVPALRTQAYVVWSNHVPTTAMRGFGVTSASFAIELQMTRNAAVLGLDPWEFRLKNANRKGDLMPTRKVLEDPSTIPTIQACAEAVGHPLSATYKELTNDERSGEWLPEHLRDQVSTAKLGNPQGAAR